MYKRLEKRRLKFPKINEQTLELTRDELNWLLSGLDYTKQEKLPVFYAENFY